MQYSPSVFRYPSLLQILTKDEVRRIVTTVKLMLEAHMATLYGKNYSKRELLERVGSISQIAGIKKVVLADGKAKGVEAYVVRNGSGLSFTVLAGRGIDISHADCCGKSLAWLSPTGEVASAYFEKDGLGWLRSFNGGLLTTCGLTQVGAPSVDQGSELGLHGRVSNIPAEQVCYSGKWVADDYVLTIEGQVREASVFGENLLLTRRISTKLGENRILIEDTVENQGHEETPHMILYHINGGFPAVDEASELLSPTVSLRPRDAQVSTENFNIFEPPTAGFAERVYYHEMASDADGTVVTALINRRIGDGFGFYVSYSKEQLPFFTEWKMNGLGTYVVGMEPGNCHAEGRAKEREYGTLQTLSPGEIRNYRIGIGTLESSEEIRALEERIIQMK